MQRGGFKMRERHTPCKACVGWGPHKHNRYSKIKIKTIRKYKKVEAKKIHPTANQ